MTELVQVLLEHAERTSIPDLLYAMGYWSASRQTSRLWKDFQRSLTQEQCDRLEALLEREGAVHATEIEATFQAGLSMGLALGRV